MPENIDKRSKSGRKPRSGDEFDEVDRPIVAWSADYPAGTELESHWHARAQLLFAASGVMTITTTEGSWVVPPRRAVWIPDGLAHAIHMAGNVAMRTLYIRPDAAGALSSSCRVLEVTPLLRELILRAMSLPPLYDPDGPDGRLMDLILDEVRALRVLPLELPLPLDGRILKICRGIQQDPGLDRGVAAWARKVGASPRTIARLFLRETGQSFGAWRQQARLLEALRRIAAGAAITTVALDLGYESASAFTYMFRRAYGVPPSRYFQCAHPTG